MQLSSHLDVHYRLPVQDITRNSRNYLPLHHLNLFKENHKPLNFKERTIITFEITANIIMAYQILDFLRNLHPHLIILFQHLYLEYIISLTGKKVFQEYSQCIVPSFNDQIHISTRLKVFYWNKKHLSKVILILFFHQVAL